MIGGHDTTSTTTLWGLKYLADSQTVQSNLRAALYQSHVAARAEGRLPSSYEITHTQIPYLEAVIEEMLRLPGTLPILDRQATQDTQILGHHVPKDTIVMIINRGPSITEPAFEITESCRSETCQRSKHVHGSREWEPEGMDRFIPERWLKVDDQGSIIFDSSAGPTLPFGLGTRGCFGRKLAYLELRIMFTLLIWRFHLRKCPEGLSGYEATDTLTHKPRNCYVKLTSI